MSSKASLVSHLSPPYGGSGDFSSKAGIYTRSVSPPYGGSGRILHQRLVCKPLSVHRSCTGLMSISLDLASPSGSCGLPGIYAAGRRCTEGARPCLTLLQVGVIWPPTLRPVRWSLTPPFHPCRIAPAVCLCDPVQRINAPGVTRHLALWRADFPRVPKNPRSSDQPR